MARVLSIDIGYSLIKILETDYKVKNPKVYACVNLDTPQGILLDGELAVTEELVDRIRQALTANRIKTRQVVFTITSTKIASRDVTLPNVKANKLGAMVRANAGEYFPVDLSQYELAYTTLGMVGEGSGGNAGVPAEKGKDKDNLQRKVQVLAAPHSILEGYQLLARALGLTLLALDYSNNSIYQVVKNECSEGIQMVIKVDERMSVVTVLEDGQITLQRSVPYGVDDAVHTMINSGAYGAANYQQALDLLRRRTCVHRVLHAQTDIAEPDAPNAEPMDDTAQMHEAKQAITEALDPLMRGIARVVDFYNSRNYGKQIQRTFLTGLGGDFSGLSKLMTNELGLHIVVLRKVEGFNIERSFREGSFGEYLACLGAVINPLGFLHDEKEAEKEKSKGFTLTPLMSGTIFVLCVVIAAALFMMAYMPYKEAQAENEAYRIRIERSATAVPAYLEYTMTKQAYEFVLTSYLTTQIPTVHLVEFIEEMEAKMPHAFYINSFSATAEGFTMNVIVATKEEAAACIQQLRTFEMISSLTVNGIYENWVTSDDRASAEDENAGEEGAQDADSEANEPEAEEGSSDDNAIGDMQGGSEGQDDLSGLFATQESTVTFSVQGTFADTYSVNTDTQTETAAPQTTDSVDDLAN